MYIRNRKEYRALTTAMRERPTARKTLLFASSGWRVTCGGGKGGREGSVAAGDRRAAASLGLELGMGLRRRGGAGGTSAGW